ncbi:hypothetical protein, partial [Bradyrhizobium brasilense]
PPGPPANAAPEKPAPVSLPHRLERMVGREDILQDLSARILSDRFVTLRGPGGIGKTTVAVALAHDMLAAFEGQVYFLDLSPLKDATLVASASLRRSALWFITPIPQTASSPFCAIVVSFSSSTVAST